MEDAKKIPKPQPPKIDWIKAQEFYLLDATITFKDVAEHFGVSQNSVSAWAKKMGWIELRNNLSETATNLMMKRLADKKAKANEKHADGYDSLRRKIISTIDGIIDDADPRDLANLAKSLDVVTKGERIVLGLPNNINAVTNKDGDDVINGLSSLWIASQKAMENGED